MIWQLFSLPESEWHMRWFEPWYNKYAVITLSAVAGIFGYEWIHWRDWSPSDWGTWAGAIGTVATLVGTIHLATTETRRRTRQEKLAAELHGVILSSRLAHVEARLMASKSLLSRALEREDIRAGLLKECHAQISAIDEFTPEDVLPIGFFAGNTGQIIVRATAGLTALRHLSNMLGALAAAPDIERVETMLGMVTDNQEMLVDAVNSLRASLKRENVLS
jgi:hypothetical protein